MRSLSIAWRQVDHTENEGESVKISDQSRLHEPKSLLAFVNEGFGSLFIGSAFF